MGLRIATEEDLDLVVQMAIKFVNTTQYKDYVTEDKIRKVAKAFINSNKEDKIILIYDDKAFLAGMVNPFMFGDVYFASEVAWWVDPECRGMNIGNELLEAFEYWAKKVNCGFVVMMSLDEDAAKIYENKGYALYERSYLKDVS